jgi:hypothetical protein
MIKKEKRYAALLNFLISVFFFSTFLLIYGASGGHLAAQGELTDPGRRFQLFPALGAAD